MEIIKLPKLIDVHVHLRTPGQTHKEDFTTASVAAVAGGYGLIVDMPNNALPITTIERLNEKIALAKDAAVDIRFHYGSLGDNLDTFEEAAKKSVGLKLYLNNTTGGYMLDVKNLVKIYDAWPADKVVLLHAEEDVIDVAIESAMISKRKIHVCHMPSEEVLTKILKAKDAGLPITCGVTPHHLFLDETDADRLGVFGRMLPSLKPKKDVQFLWDHLSDIDLIESDHAPHTIKEKNEGAFGVPGLQTTLPLLLTAMREGKLTLDEIKRLCHTAPAKIFGLPTDTGELEIELSEFTIKNEDQKSKCGWTPFDGRKVYGQIKS